MLLSNRSLEATQIFKTLSEDKNPNSNPHTTRTLNIPSETKQNNHQHGKRCGRGSKQTPMCRDGHRRPPHQRLGALNLTPGAGSVGADLTHIHRHHT